jgi:hypothetical protein
MVKEVLPTLIEMKETPEKERVKVDEDYERMASSFYRVLRDYKNYRVCGMIGGPSIDLKGLSELKKAKNTSFVNLSVDQYVCTLEVQ